MSDFIFLGFKINVDGDCSHEIKRHLLLGRTAMTNLDRAFKKQRHQLAEKVPYSQGYGFSSSHVWMWTVKKAEYRKINAFELWGWRRLLRVPWTARSNQSILKEINPEYSSEGLMPKLKLRYSDHLMRRANSLEKTLMLGKIEGKRRSGW